MRPKKRRIDLNNYQKRSSQTHNDPIGVLFDCDGVLVDSEPAMAEIGRTAAELIFARLSGEEKEIFKRVIFEPRIIVRVSSVFRS